MGELECKCAVDYADTLRAIEFVKTRLERAKLEIEEEESPKSSGSVLSPKGGFDLIRATSLVKGLLTVDLSELEMHCGIKLPKKEEDLAKLSEELESKNMAASRATLETISLSVSEEMSKCANPEMHHTPFGQALKGKH